jgi:hypothetical protein
MTWRTHGLTALVVGVAGLVGAPAAFAQTFTVTASTGTGSGSLADAVTQANTDGGTNAIHFQAGLGTITLTAAGIPAITDPGLTIDGCAPAAPTAGSCQTINTAAVNSGDPLFDLQASGVTLSGLKVSDAAGDSSASVIDDEAGSDHLALLDDTITGPTTTGFPAISAAANDLTIGGLDPTTHQPDHPVTINSDAVAIELDGGDDDVIAGNNISVRNNDALETDDPLTGLRIEANTFTATSVGTGIVLNQGILTDVGDPNLQAPPNTFSGFDTPVEVVDPASALFYDNTNQISSSPQTFYDLESGANAGISAPAIANATPTSVSGTATPGDTVELLDAGPGPVNATDLLKGVLGTATTDGGGDWTITPATALTAGHYVSALQTSAGNGSSSNTPAVIVTATLPTVSTSAATAVTTTGAVLHGTVNPNGASTAYYFEYKAQGASSYTKQPASPASAGSGTTAQPETATLTGLTQSTGYTYHVVATNGAGPVTSTPDTTFTTAVRYTVSATENPTAGGSVTATSPSLGSSCSGSSCTVNPGSEVELLAAPASGYEFTGWSGACTNSSTGCKLGPISADQTATANFQVIAGAISIFKEAVNTDTDESAEGIKLDVGVDPGSHTVNCSIEWGPTIAYGQQETFCNNLVTSTLFGQTCTGMSTAESGCAKRAPVVIPARSLTAFTTYHYRVVIVDVSGAPQVSGPDQVFEAPGFTAATTAPTNLDTTSVTLNATAQYYDAIADAWKLELFKPGSSQPEAQMPSIRSTSCSSDPTLCQQLSETASFKGLTAGTTYSYRLSYEAADNAREIAGKLLPATEDAPRPTATPSATFTTPSVALPTNGSVTGSTVTAVVPCDTSRACSGTQAYYGESDATAAAAGSKPKLGKLLGRATFKIPGHKHAAVRVPLNAAGKKVFSKRHTAKVTEVITQRVHGHAVTATATITLRKK